MLKRLRACTAAALVLAALALSGCKGDEGPAGPAGTNPPAAPVISAVYAVPDSIGTSESTTLIANAYDPNGDPLTYQWSASSGTLATPTAATTHWTADSIGVFTITVTVSDGQRTANGSVMVGVNHYVPAVTPSYLGSDAQNCAPCHQSTIDSWSGTPHATAFDSSAAPVEHKTTGFNPALDNGGYDDNPSAALANVQCEACHGPLGPGAAVTNHPFLSNDAMTGAACGQCHAEWTEYGYSGHGTAMERAGGHEEFRTEFGRAPCQDCHVGEGFVKRFDADWADRPVPHLLNQVTCGSCHDPHNSPAGNPEQLRSLADFVLPYGGPDVSGGFTVTGWNKGQLCGQCHHSRRDSTYIFNAVFNGAQRANPHESPQADMVAGRGSYEIPGLTYVRDNQHNLGHPRLKIIACTVTWWTRPRLIRMPSTTSMRTCVPARAATALPRISTSTASRRKSRGYWISLGQMLPNTQDENGHFIVVEDTRDSTVWSDAMRAAAWAWAFVDRDGSRGVHNYNYARTLLANAIDYLTPPGATALPGDRPLRAPVPQRNTMLGWLRGRG